MLLMLKGRKRDVATECKLYAKKKKEKKNNFYVRPAATYLCMKVVLSVQRFFRIHVYASS